MNRELIAENDKDDDQDDPFKRVNAYGLMKKKEEAQTKSIHPDSDYNSISGNDYYNKSIADITDQRFRGGGKHRGFMEPKKSKKSKKKGASKKQSSNSKNNGKFVESKQMVFTDLQMLVPSTKSNEFVPGYLESTDQNRNDSGQHDLKPVLDNM